jgi:hypothetical protein
MSATAGWKGTLQESGTAVGTTGEACSFVSGTDPNKVYQVTNAAHHVWDPTVPVTVKDGGTPVAAANYSYDYLSGTITFIGHTVVGAITVDGSYLPVVTVATVRKSTLKLHRDDLDASNFDDATGWKSLINGIASGSVDVELLQQLSTTQDAEVGGQWLFWKSDRPKVLILGDTAQSKKWRLWVKSTDLEQSTDVAGLVVGNISWTQSAWNGSTVSYNT